jgi:hypothetical protein
MNDAPFEPRYSEEYRKIGAETSNVMPSVSQWNAGIEEVLARGADGKLSCGPDSFRRGGPECATW